VWVSSSTLIALAFTLTAMSYLIGLLLLSMPFGSRGIRNMGKSMITESASSIGLIVVLMAFMATWTTILNGLLANAAVSMTLSLPCVSPKPTVGTGGPNIYEFALAYQYANNWIINQRNAAACVGISIQTLGLAIRNLSQIPVLGSVIGSFSTLWDSYMSTMVSATNGYVQTLTILLVWTQFIGPPGNFWAIFLIVGSFCYAIPGRVGRAAAGLLIGHALAFMLAIPFLPFFVDNFNGDLMAASASILAQAPVQQLFTPSPTLIVSGAFSLISSVLALPDILNSLTIMMSRLIFIGIYLVFIGSLNAGLAKVLTGTSPASVPGGAV